MIIGTPRILFLGAGASKPFKKMLMGEFVKELRAKRPEDALLKVLADEKEDLEFLLGELEEICSKGYLAGAQIRTASLAGSPGSSIALWAEAKPLIQTADVLTRFIKREVYLHYRSIDNHSELLRIYDSLFERFGAGGKDYVVFTTNYDPSIEIFVSEHEDLQLVAGFKHNPKLQQYVWERSVFGDFKPDPVVGSVVLFKLHGSTDWFSSKGRITKNDPIFAGNDAEFEQVLIYPATRKIANADPFFTAYDYLEKCLSRAQECLTIGYSFRDYDTRMRFKAASLWNPKLRVLVLDPNATQLAAELEKEQIRAVPLPFKFGVEENEYLDELDRRLRSAAAR